MESLARSVIALNPSYVATSYDGSARGYQAKNLFESFILASGINVIDCKSSTPSMLSSSMEEIKADLGLFFNEKGHIIFDHRGIPFVIKEEAPNLPLKEWKEIGSLEEIEISRIYSKKLRSVFKLNSKKLGHVLANLNFSPLSKVAPYILRDISSRLTTLNANEEETLDQSFDEALTITKEAMKAYKAEISFVFDRLGERIVLIDSDKDFLKHACSFILKNDREIEEVLVLGNVDLELQGVRFRKIDFEGVVFDRTKLIVDGERNSVIYPKISWWFDSFATFLSWYMDKF